jgi:hypothetical protein
MAMKRPHELVSSGDASCGMLVTAHSGFDAPQPKVCSRIALSQVGLELTQQQVQPTPPSADSSSAPTPPSADLPSTPRPSPASPSSPSTPGALPIPGRWPREYDTPRRVALDENDDAIDNAPMPVGRGVTEIMGRWYYRGRDLYNYLVSPARALQQYFSAQRVIVQPVIRADGARKRRIIDAGHAEEFAAPVAPVASLRHRLAPPFTRKPYEPGRGRNKNHIVPMHLRKNRTDPTRGPFYEPGVASLADSAPDARMDIENTNSASNAEIHVGHTESAPDAGNNVKHTDSAPATTVDNALDADIDMAGGPSTESSDSSPSRNTTQDAEGDINMDEDDDDDDLSIGWDEAWSSPVPNDRPADYLTASAIPSPPVFTPASLAPATPSPQASQPASLAPATPNPQAFQPASLASTTPSTEVSQPASLASSTPSTQVSQPAAAIPNPQAPQPVSLASATPSTQVLQSASLASAPSGPQVLQPVTATSNPPVSTPALLASATSGPQVLQPVSAALPAPTNGQLAPQNSQLVSQHVRGIEDLSPNTHLRIIRSSSATPMRKMLIAGQAKSYGAFHVVATPPADHTGPSRVSNTHEGSELQRKLYEASMLEREAATVALNAHEASEAYKARAKARAEAREARKAKTPTVTPVPEGIPAAEQAYYNYAPTVDTDLSFLSDATDDDEEAVVAPSPSPQKTARVRWETHAKTKSFFCDEEVAEMADSTLESIKFSPGPYRTREANEDVQSDASDTEDAQQGSGPSTSPIKGQNDAQHDSPAKESRGFRGVPDSTWDDSDISLDESELSHELFDDLQDEWQKKMAVSPAAVQSQAPAALVTPLSAPERKKLYAAAAKAAAKAAADAKHLAETGEMPKTGNWVVNEKLSARDFATLLPSEFHGDPKAWLNDNIVNEYLSIVTGAKKDEAGFVPKKGGPAPPLHAFSSFWYPTAKNSIKGVSRWAKRFYLEGAQYLDADLILYPICDGHHWRLLAVRPKDRTIEVFDSLGFGGDKYIAKLKEYLAAELGRAWVEDEWTVLQPQRSARQKNASDCGVFTILNALALLRGEEFNKVIVCDGMKDARERIAITLMAGAPTTEFE